MQTTLILFFTLALIYCLQKLLAYLSAIRSVKYVIKKKPSHVHRKLTFFFIRNIQGYRVFLSPTNPLGYILPRIPIICIGNNHFFEDKHARTLICTDDWQHSWFRYRSLWICWLGCNFHSKASPAAMRHLNSLIYWLFRYLHFPKTKQSLFSPMLRLSKSATSNPRVLLIHICLWMIRKSQQQGLDFQNLHVNMKSFQSMVPVSWALKVENGKNIEKYLHPLSLMCVSYRCPTCYWFSNWRLFFFFWTSEIINLSGMRLLKSWMIFSVRFGQAKM